MPQNIHAKVDETFEVSLEGSAGTGFRWELDPLPATARLVELLKEDRAAVSIAPGGRTVQRFQFRAVSPGKANLTFRHRRAWEDPASGTVQVVTIQIDTSAEPS
jgi:predicted secreted protein